MTGVAESAASRWPARIFLAACLLVIAAGIVHFVNFDPDKPKSGIIDFDAFYLAGKLVWQGRAADAYQFELFVLEQRPYSTLTAFMPWTYPPQFELVVALFSPLPRPFAYLAFTLLSLFGFLVATRRLYGSEPVAALLPVVPSVLLTLFIGQNGLLTAGLTAFAAAGLIERRGWAGVALGLLVIKPHLALGLAVYAVIDGRWRTVAVAAATVGASMLLTTLLLGPGIWAAFLGGVEEASGFFAGSDYYFYRMTSVYTALRTWGLPFEIAMPVQTAVTVAALGLVVVAQRRLAAREAVGIAICAGLLCSPYSYFYDLPVFGVGLSLLYPALRRSGSIAEWWTIAGLVAVACLNGFVQALRSNPLAVPHEEFVTVAAFALIAALALIWRILTRRQRQPATQDSNSVRAMASGGGASQSPVPASAARTSSRVTQRASSISSPSIASS